MSLKYHGDRVEVYDHARRSGLIGKVIGPDAKGAYLIVTAAVYDDEQDITYATTESILSPEQSLAREQVDE